MPILLHMDLESLKKQRIITRENIEELFASIGAPGENQEEKIQAMKYLDRHNNQNIDISETVESYRNF